MITRRYNLINNLGGWFVFLVALATYWLTLEPTASYWDCGEFIIQADKLEVGHPPGNPIFMLTARFFANFAPSSQYVALMVNAMSGLLSALTIMLLFWTVTHLTRRLLVKDNHCGELPLPRLLVIVGAGLVGSLAYCWSDTFWFSAVEGEVYAFSSFCTALVFWLILKWENRADQPHSDRYLILIMYIIGVSVAVHLLNLLCIPAIVLVFAYRKVKDMNLVKSLIALAISFGIVFVVLYGLVPGFIKVAQEFELLFVNSFGLPYNTGAAVYAVVITGAFCWAILAMRAQRSASAIRWSFLTATLLSGALWIGSSIWLGLILAAALAAMLWIVWRNRLPLRWLNIALWGMAVIFIGYSSYALILIRSSADTPMNQNSPDNVFDLASYLNREQYGENPLLYGETLNSAPMKRVEYIYTDTLGMRDDGSAVTLATPRYNTVVEKGKPLYSKMVAGAEPSSEYGFLSASDRASNAKLTRRGKDAYVKRDYKPEPKMNPELNMLFPRIYSRMHRDAYKTWVDLDTLGGSLQPLYALDEAGNKVPELNTSAEPVYNEYSGTLAYPQKQAFKPGLLQNLSYFFNYQLNHMYTRYFMWNFAGRQNDLLNQQGELDAGNWISGIPFIDNPRLGDQSLLPSALGKDNPGHNVYYMLPLILGLLGLIWQSFEGKRGIEQFWVVFFLFFMTGIAIVLYLNQPPQQPRERDYAFAGSFYAFAIWIGMGVPALWRLLKLGIAKGARKPSDTPSGSADATAQAEDTVLPAQNRLQVLAAAAAVIMGLAVPAQMVSQTWDDHDRSGRYAARDYAINYLESLEKDAIVFCNGDNDTFPLWYAQEVEGVRPDVKIVNLSYLNSDWYANQMRSQSYTAPGIHFTATPADYAYGKADVTLLGPDTAPVDLREALKAVYSGYGRAENGYPTLPSTTVAIPVDADQVIAAGLVAPEDRDAIEPYITVDLSKTQSYRSKGYISLGELLMLDILATNAAEGWKRPVYWAMTVGDEYHLGLTPYLRSTGMTHQLVPTRQPDMAPRTDRAYEVVTEKYRWGGADKATAVDAPYFDETARRMLMSVRSSMVEVASQLIAEGDRLMPADREKALEKYRMSLKVCNLIQSKLGEATGDYSLSNALTLGQIYAELGGADMLANPALTKKGLGLLKKMLDKYAPYVRYSQAVNLSFGQAPLTYESQLIPYQYQRIIDLYLKYGGKKSEVEGIMKKYGLDAERLKQYYDYYNGAASGAPQGSSAGDAGFGALGISEDELLEEIAKYCEIANRMATLGPTEYKDATADEKMIDSALYSVIELYIEAGGSQEQLDKYPAYRALDKQRAKRLSAEADAH